jgi:ATP-dependent DNA helicase RecQ
VRAFGGGIAEARAVLLEHFGYQRFRPAQLRVLAPLLAGHDVLAVLPTGAGKSLCYQVPALMAKARGTTLVVSPLISLMQDQVTALKAAGVAAGYLSAAQNAKERDAVLESLRAQALTLLYCAPERLKQVIPLVPRCPLLAVDEAHCVVEWGHEFRPHYRALGHYRSRLGHPTTIALTGSATPAARTEILRSLRLARAEVVVTSFDRPNLSFAVRQVATDRERFAVILDQVRRGGMTSGGQTLVYTPTRRLSEVVARALLLRSVRAAPYHAGLSPGTRRRVLDRFLENRSQVIVATSAFGMGIDKPDVRRVFHWGPSRTLESYYQEAGRGGRDGAPATCVVLWRPGDLTWDTVAPAMRAYLVGRDCRRRMLLGYFGESVTGCSGCDRCGNR